MKYSDENVGFQIHVLTEKIERLERAVEKMAGEITTIKDASNRWKGGFIVVVAFGGLLGWVASFGGNVLKFFK